MDRQSPYGQAKRISEWMCAMYAAQYGFAALIARLFTFVGPHLPLDANFAVGNFIRDAMKRRPHPHRRRRDALPLLSLRRRPGHLALDDSHKRRIVPAL